MTKKDWLTYKPLARALLDSHGLSDWTVHIHSLSRTSFHTQLANGKILPAQGKTCLGMACAKDKFILLNWGLRKEKFRQTMLHEIAHALRGPDGDHDLTWARVALNIGCTWNEVRETYLESHSLSGLCTRNVNQERLYLDQITYEFFARGLLPLALSAAELRKEPHLVTWGVTVKEKSKKKRGTKP